MKKFLKSKIFWVALVLQIAGPLLATFGNWANVIQYIGGFGMAYGLFAYIEEHKAELVLRKEEIAFLKAQILHLHKKHDDLHGKIDSKGVSA